MAVIDDVRLVNLHRRAVTAAVGVLQEAAGTGPADMLATAAMLITCTLLADGREHDKASVLRMVGKAVDEMLLALATQKEREQ